MKTTRTALLAFLLLATACPLTAQFNFTTNAGTISIIGFEGSGGVVAIPALINGLPVTTIGTGAFSNVTTLTGVTVQAGITSLAEYAFAGCTNLAGVYFSGNRPSADSTTFTSDSNTTVYYLANATGWTSSYAGLPAVLWNPLIQTGGTNFGLENNQFGFNIAGPTNMLVVVAACSNLATPLWAPVQTLTLTSGLARFSEPWQSNSAARYYGLGFPTGTVQTNSSLPSPVLRWKLNEGSGTNVADSSGNGYNGVFSGPPDPTWVAYGNDISTPASSAAYAVDCENSWTKPDYGGGGVYGLDYVTQIGGVQHATISCWIYQTSDDSSTVGFGQDGSVTHVFSVGPSTDEAQGYVTCANGTTASTIFTWGAATPNSIGWNDFVITFDGTQGVASNRVVLYTNGVVCPQYPNEGSFPTTLPSAANLGYPTLSNPNAGWPYGGAYCDFQIWTVTLTQAQVTALYRKGPDN